MADFAGKLITENLLKPVVMKVMYISMYLMLSEGKNQEEHVEHQISVNEIIVANFLSNIEKRRREKNLLNGKYMFTNDSTNH